MSARARFSLSVAAIALCAWLAAEAVSSRGLPAQLAALIAVSGALAVLAARGQARRLASLRDALERASAGLPSDQPGRSEPGEIGALARAISAAQAALHASAMRAEAERERLEAVLDGMVEGVLVTATDGGVQLANTRLRELFDAWGEVAGRRVLEVVRRADVAEALERAAGSKEPVAIEIALANDGLLEMHARRFPERGEMQGVVAVFHDVSEIRRLENHRRDFVANVSHELRTPLTAIQGFAETLRDESLDADRRRQFVDVISRNAERLRALIEDLLELSRIEGRTLPLALEPVDTAAVTTSLLRDLRPRLDARSLEASLRGAARPVLADRRALEQVLQNLLDNAVKYTEPGGRIEVRLANGEGKVRVEVADTGIGIPDRDRSRVFERFYRVEKARSRDLGGTGLGLAIVKHLVQAMDGEVFLSSREGEGTTFTVVLPAA
ncbi:MAG TPA: ATP-binding protein [Myxococcota bacterium]|nr:ATP-binding protein [Myxococcota bacterium]